MCPRFLLNRAFIPVVALFFIAIRFLITCFLLVIAR